jgi:hypothetical protein
MGSTSKVCSGKTIIGEQNKKPGGAKLGGFLGSDAL